MSPIADACQAGRSMGCDDRGLLGLDFIGSVLDRDGVCGFRLIRAEAVQALEAWLAQRSCRLETRDVFLADRDTALAASERLLRRASWVRSAAQPRSPSGPAELQVMIPVDCLVCHD